MAKRKKPKAEEPPVSPPASVEAEEAAGKEPAPPQPTLRLTPECWHIIEITDGAEINYYPMESESEVVARASSMLNDDSQVFVFYGQRIYTSKPPHPFLLMADGRRLPLFNLPSQEQMEIDEMTKPVQPFGSVVEDEPKPTAAVAVAELEEEEVDDEDIDDDDDFDDEDDEDDEDDDFDDDDDEDVDEADGYFDDDDNDLEDSSDDD